jgi:hypothetical protein
LSFGAVNRPRTYVSEVPSQLPIFGGSWEGWTEIPTGESEINITFKALESDIFKWVVKSRVSDARIFDEYVRETHAIPQDVDVWKKLSVVNVMYSYMHGMYKAVSFDFKDGSSYERGKVYD